MVCSALHEHFPVIPEPIREYIEEVKAQLEEVAGSPGEQSGPRPAIGAAKGKLGASGAWRCTEAVRLPWVQGWKPEATGGAFCWA